jgi:ABC-type molybdate transport system substrate-binding protein
MPLSLTRRSVLVAALALSLGVAASAAELRVMTSGTFTGAYLALIPTCAAARGDTVVTVTTSMGVGDASIPSRLQRREPADVVIVDRDALNNLISQGAVRPGSRVDLARSAIGVAVRAGTPKRGDAEIGFQQISELLPIAGIEYVGALPPELQKVTVVSAGLAAGTTLPEQAAAFIGCLASREAAAFVARSGLEPRHEVAELRPEFRALARIGPFFEK